MRACIRKPAIFVVVSLFVIALTFEYYITALFVFAEPYGKVSCQRTGTLKVKCCQDHIEKTSTGVGFDIVKYCTDCDVGPGGFETSGYSNYHNCSERYIEMSAEQPPTPPIPTPPTAGENIVPGDTGVLEQPPRPPTFDPTAPLQGGVLEQQEPQTPPAFAPGTTPGVLEQQEQQTPPPPPFVPGFLERQQQPPTDQGAAGEPPTGEGAQPAVPEAEPPVTEEADQGTTAVPRPVQPLTRTCPVGNVWDPDLMICVPDVPPLELCPDGSIPQPTGPGGIRPECPLSEAQQLQAEEPEQTPTEEPEQPGAQEEPQEQPSDVGGEEQSDQEVDGSEDSSNNN